MKLLLPVVAYLLSIVVTLPLIDPDVDANEDDTVLEVASRLVTRVLKEELAEEYEADTTENDADAVVNTEAVLSRFVVLILKEELVSAKEADADVSTDAVDSRSVTLILKEALVTANEADIVLAFTA